MDFVHLATENQTTWEANAEWWDATIGAEGNDFHRTLIVPSVDRLLDVCPDEEVLEIACGNGAYARHLAAKGARVTATDFSEKFLERARLHTSALADHIDYRLLDATDESALMALESRRFDAAVCNMGLMDMTTIGPLMSALARTLKTGGRFVFSILHPCFNQSGASQVAEAEDRNGEITLTYGVKVTRYITPHAEQGIGIVGQPAPHYYFHRPISTLFNGCFHAGFALDGMEEPLYGDDAVSNRWWGWKNFREIPPALIVRMRLV